LYTATLGFPYFQKPDSAILSALAPAFTPAAKKTTDDTILSALAPAFTPAAKKTADDTTLSDVNSQQSKEELLATRRINMAKNERKIAQQTAIFAKRNVVRQQLNKTIKKMLIVQAQKRQDNEIAQFVVEGRASKRQANERKKETSFARNTKMKAKREEVPAQQATKKSEEVPAQQATKKSEEVPAQQATKKSEEVPAQQATKPPVKNRATRAAGKHTTKKPSVARTDTANEWNAVAFATALANATSAKEEVFTLWNDSIWRD
jgi:hypothetical protein